MLSGSANAGTINKGMTIVSMGGGTAITSGVKVTGRNTSSSPNTVTLNKGQSVASTELIGFAHVLVADNTVKTIDENGIYAEYINFPKNNSTTNITFTITLTENSTNSFIGFNSPETLSIVSLTDLQSSPAYIAATEARVTKSNQAPATSSVSTGRGSTVRGLGTTNNSNLGY